MVAGLRRNTGQPHWIVVDEAHYFLHEPDFRQRLDIELAGYMLVTHRVSNLPPDLLKEVESIIVTQITDPREAHALTTMYGRAGEEAEWESLLNGLTIDEAALLPAGRTLPDAQAQADFTELAGRMTPHVRHRSKYLEVPMLEHHAFASSPATGVESADSARTLKEFVTMMARVFRWPRSRALRDAVTSRAGSPMCSGTSPCRGRTAQGRAAIPARPR